MSGFLLDTNIPSETIRTRPDPRVDAWVRQQDDTTLHLSAITIGELRKGLTILPEGKRRSQLQDWLDNDLIPLFTGRILPVTQAIADRWGALKWPAADRRTSAQHGRRIDRGHRVGARPCPCHPQRPGLPEFGPATPKPLGRKQ